MSNDRLLLYFNMPVSTKHYIGSICVPLLLLGNFFKLRNVSEKILSRLSSSSSSSNNDKTAKEATASDTNDVIMHNLLHRNNSQDDIGLNNNNISLRLPWHDLPPLSAMAKKYRDHQHNCELPIKYYPFRVFGNNSFGLGSDLHTMQNAIYIGLCNGHRIKAAHSLSAQQSSEPGLLWSWWDQTLCTNTTKGENILSCYFPSLVAECPGDTDLNNNDNISSVIVGGADTRLDRVIQTQIGRRFRSVRKLQQRRNPLTEFMFSKVSPLIINEAKQQLARVFPAGVVPNHLTVVHMRWGDKSSEMRLVNVEQYVDAVKAITAHLNDTTNTRHVLLCTEDPRAVKAFRNTIPSDWELYIDGFYTKYAPFRERVPPTKEEQAGRYWKGENSTAYNVAGRVGSLSRGAERGSGRWDLCWWPCRG